jgi:LuxR family maltose regulon positive regulatory protein
VGEATAESVAPQRALRAALLQTKTRVPRWRSGAVSRRALIERARGSGSNVVTVTAAAGYGKSTMLAEWGAVETRAVGGVALDRVDYEPSALLAAIATAAAGFAPNAEGIVEKTSDYAGDALGRSAPLLAAALATSPDDFVLFIDDLHWASSDDCSDVIDVLLQAVPAASQVVVSSRHDHPPIARLRAGGGVHEVDAESLRLDVAGARSIFDGAGASDISESELATIVARCEGWPTGIYLSALVSRAGGDPTTLTGNDRFFSDYLYSECVRRLPEQTQRFLRRSAVLEQLSPAACNEVLQVSTSRGVLQEIAAANLFVIPLDHEREWYRYHALFREFLVAELERVEGAEALNALHVRAADWCERDGSPAAAVDHLLAAGESARAARIVAEISLSMYQQGKTATVLRWLSVLGASVVRDDWQLVVSTTWTMILAGNVREGERWSRYLNSIEPGTLSAEDREAFVSARAMIRAAVCENGFQQVSRDAAYSLAHEPYDSPWRDQALHLWGSACLLRDDLEGAHDAFVEAVTVAEIMENSDTVILSEPELALDALRDGQLSAAADHADRGVACIDAHHMDGYPTTALALAVAARIALARGQHQYGERLVARAMRARVGCTYLLPYLSVRVRLQLAKALVAMGNNAGAWHLVHEIDEILRRRGDLGVVSAQVDEFRLSLTVEPTGAGRVPLTPAELRVLPYLQTHLTIAEIAQRLFVSRNTVGSQVSSIYRKLSASSRGSAVERATSLGLLGG